MGPAPPDGPPAPPPENDVGDALIDVVAPVPPVLTLPVAVAPPPAPAH